MWNRTLLQIARRIGTNGVPPVRTNTETLRVNRHAETMSLWTWIYSTYNGLRSSSIHRKHQVFFYCPLGFWVNMHKDQLSLLITNYVFLSLSVIVVLLRCWARISIRAWGYDDVLMVIAEVCLCCFNQIRSGSVPWSLFTNGKWLDLLRCVYNWSHCGMPLGYWRA